MHFNILFAFEIIISHSFFEEYEHKAGVSFQRDNEWNWVASFVREKGRIMRRFILFSCRETMRHELNVKAVNLSGFKSLEMRFVSQFQSLYASFDCILSQFHSNRNFLCNLHDNRSAVCTIFLLYFWFIFLCCFCCLCRCFWRLAKTALHRIIKCVCPLRIA